MTLRLHRAVRVAALAEGLADLLREPPEDPFATDVVVVPARGVERWLSQRLSHHLGSRPGYADGVCAAVDLRSPASLVAEITGLGEDDPWAPDALAWPLLGVIDEVVTEPWAATLAQHLGHGLTGEEADLRRGRRFALARRLAGLLMSYAAQRPGLLADWSAGGDADGAGGRVPPDLAWQPQLWRCLERAVAAPTPDQRHRATVDRLVDDPTSVALPDRVSLFGHTRLSRTDVELLVALAGHREVHLWLPHPSPALWSALEGTAGEGPVPRRSDDSHRLVGHPLLASLGRDVRELQRLLPAGETAPATGSDAPSARPATLLGWLQQDLSANARGDRDARQVDEHDRSVQVHACHGPPRQVEVLREVVVGLLADDPTLEPRDIVVLCPDIETYAPLVQAGFGLTEVVGGHGHPAHQLRVRLADRALHQTNALLGVADRLLELAAGRAGASEVLDLAHADVVRRRFGFSDDDLEQLADWVRQTGIRWAFDAGHRSDYGLEGFVQNTWRFGLDRLLAGVALSDDSGIWLGTTLPLDDVGSGEIDLVGRLAEFVDRLAATTDGLTGTRPLDAWITALGEGIDALTAPAPADGWQAGQAHRELDRILSEAGTRDRTLLRLSDVRALLGHRLAGRPTRASFRTGTLTVCTMVPMRSVPHRVVCLLGLDDGVFPRAGVADGDDLLARDPMTGERDPRSEDRQLLLDGLMATTETLVVTYTGADAYTGQPRPPAVPLGELLDSLDDTARTPTGATVSEQVTVHHPLQPFDARNLVAGALVPDAAFSFDPTALAGATAAARPRHQPPGFLPGPLPPLPAADVALDALLGFWRNPVADFLRTRLDVALSRDEDVVEDSLPVELDALGQWGVGDRVLRDLVSGIDPTRAREQEWRRGVLPPGRLGWRQLGTIVDRAVPLAQQALALRTAAPRAVDVDLDLGDGRWLRGTVPGVYGDRLVPVGYSKLGARQRLQSWVQLLALTAADPDHNWTAHTVGRPENFRSRAGSAVSLLGPLPDQEALATLRDLVALRDHGLAAPLPFPLKTSLRYARMRRTQATSDEALTKAGYEWTDGRFPGECSDPEQVRVWGRRSPVPGRTEPPAAGEEYAGEPTRFGALALRVWSPVLTAEQGSW